MGNDDDNDDNEKKFILSIKHKHFKEEINKLYVCFIFSIHHKCLESNLGTAIFLPA